MKKIGIITYYYYYNYGTMLQAYATQQIFNTLDNIEAEIIDYRVAEKNITKKSLISTRFKRIFIYIKEFKRVLVTFLYQSKMKCRNPYFDKFVNDYIKQSNETFWYNTELMSICDKYNIFVTGSDQTWSPKIGLNPAMFLSFVSNNAVKSAYAPSIGVSSLTEEQIVYFQKYLKNYKYLSCRESIGSELLKNILHREVVTVLDPTLMVSNADWRKILIAPSIKKPYILCYFLGHRQYYRDFVKQLSKQTRLDIYYIPCSYKDCNKKNNLLFEVGPCEFLGLIDNASIICTDSFHGMAFSTNFNKNFYGFVKHEGGLSGDNSRIVDFLSRLELDNRLILDYVNGSTINVENINYKLVNNKLEQLRSDSWKYINSIVEGD